MCCVVATVRFSTLTSEISQGFGFDSQSFLVKSGTDKATGFSYRIFSDGWLEQFITVPQNAQSITFPYSFKDTNYGVFCGGGQLYDSGIRVASTNIINQKRVDGFNTYYLVGSSLTAGWGSIPLLVQGYINPSQMPEIPKKAINNLVGIYLA